MAKMNLNADEGVKQTKTGSALSECKTEQDVLDFRAEMSEKLDKDGNIFIMDTELPIGEAEAFMKETLDCKEVLTKDVFDYSMKNLKKVNPSSKIEGFEFVEFTNNPLENRARINFLYYGTQHMNQIRKANKLLARMKEDYYKVFSGETSLLDHLGIE